MSGYSSSHGPDYSPRAGGTPNSEKSSTRRKQKCPTKSANEIIADAGDETDDESRAELAPLSEHPQPIMYHQEIVNISPVTVTCSSNGGEEIVGYNQSQFLDEVKCYAEIRRGLESFFVMGGKLQPIVLLLLPIRV